MLYADSEVVLESRFVAVRMTCASILWPCCDVTSGHVKMNKLVVVDVTLKPTDAGYISTGCRLRFAVIVFGNFVLVYALFCRRLILPNLFFRRKV